MILELDTSNRYNKRVTLKESGQIIASKTTDGDVLTAVKGLLEENDLTLAGLEKVVAITKGESFTGLRVGSSIANALNFALGKINKFDEDLIFPKYSSPPKVTLKN